VEEDKKYLAASKILLLLGFKLDYYQSKDKIIFMNYRENNV